MSLELASVGITSCSTRLPRLTTQQMGARRSQFYEMCENSGLVKFGIRSDCEVNLVWHQQPHLLPPPPLFIRWLIAFPLPSPETLLHLFTLTVFTLICSPVMVMKRRRRVAWHRERNVAHEAED